MRTPTNGLHSYSNRFWLYHKQTIQMASNKLNDNYHNCCRKVRAVQTSCCMIMNESMCMQFIRLINWNNQWAFRVIKTISRWMAYQLMAITTDILIHPNKSQAVNLNDACARDVHATAQHQQNLLVQHRCGTHGLVNYLKTELVELHWYSFTINIIIHSF